MSERPSLQRKKQPEPEQVSLRQPTVGVMPQADGMTLPPGQEAAQPEGRLPDADAVEQLARLGSNYSRISVHGAAPPALPPGRPRLNSPPQIQRQPDSADAGASATPETIAAAGLIVEDTAEPTPEQMTKTAFLDQLETAVCTTAESALAGSLWSAAGCPYITRWLSYYRTRDAQQVERAMRRYAPETAGLASAQACIPLISERVGRGIAVWLATGQVTGVPAEAAADAAAAPSPDAGAAPEAEGAESVALKSADGSTTTPTDAQNVQRRLGEGSPLGGDARSRMESAFGEDFGAVRIHTDPRAGSLARDLHARAFTVGSDVAFAAGQYQPGTPIGDALLAHELAHVVQQQSAPVGKAQAKSDAAYGALEADADTAAVGAVVSLWGGARGMLGRMARQALPALKSGLQLQRCSDPPAASGPVPSGPIPSGPAPAVVRPPDQHAGTAVPDAAHQAAIAAELNPTSSSVGGVPVPWDGAIDNLTLTAAERATRIRMRNQLKRQITNALNAHLRRAMREVRATERLRRLPMTEFEGAGRAAKRVTDSHFGSLMSAAALTPGQATQHATFDFRGSAPNQTLFDAYDPAQRAATGHDIDPDDLAGWMAETDTASQTAQQAHGFNPNRDAGATRVVNGVSVTGGEEELFLLNEILNPFVAAHRRELERYDQFGFAISGDQIVAPSSVMGGMSDRPGTGGTPSPAERAAKWGMWKLLVHEYIHTLEHSAFSSASRGNRIMKEGFCEMFTKEILQAELPGAASNAALAAEIEGGAFPTPSAQIVGGYDAGMYADYLAHAEAIRDTAIGGPGGANAVKAAFFQGHVEFLGLTPAGGAATPAVGGADRITVPASITTMAALATATGVAEADILSANPGLTAAGPLPSNLNVPGCRDHMVVQASDGRIGGVRTVETKAQIATQNGLVEADLDRANPGVNWTTLTQGQIILIPRH